MTTMVEVRGAPAMAPETEARTGAVSVIHEAVIQTPSAFYAGGSSSGSSNPSSRIWGASPPPAFLRVGDASGSFVAPSESSDSSYATAPVSFASGWSGARSHRKGAASAVPPGPAGPAVPASASSGGASSTFVSASSSSSFQSFSSPTSAFSSPAAVSSSAPAVGSGSSGSEAAMAKGARRQAGRQDSGTSTRAPAGFRAGQEQEAASDEEAASGKLKAGLQNSGKASFKNSAKGESWNSSDFRAADAGFRFQSMKGSGESSAPGGNVGFRFGADNAAAAAFAGGGGGFRFGARVAADEFRASVTAHTALAFQSESSVLSGLSRLDLNSETVVSGARAGAGRESVFTRDVFCRVKAENGVGSVSQNADSQSPGLKYGVEPLTESNRVSSKFNRATPLPGGTSADDAMESSSTNAPKFGQPGFSREEVSSGQSRFKVENVGPSADAPHADMSGRSSGRFKLGSGAAATSTHKQQAASDHVSPTAKFAEFTGETLAGVGDQENFRPRANGRTLDREHLFSFEGRPFPASFLKNGNGSAGLESPTSSNEGSSPVFVFGATPAARAGASQDQEIDVSRLPRGFSKQRRRSFSLKTKGLALSGHSTVSFSDVTSSVTSGASQGEASSADAVFDFQEAADRIFKAGPVQGSGDVPSGVEPTHGATPSRTPAEEPQSADVPSPPVAGAEGLSPPPQVGATNWNVVFAGVGNLFKQSFSLHDNVEQRGFSGSASPPPPPIEPLLFSFQSFDLSGPETEGNAGANSGPFVFGATRAVPVESQQHPSAVKRKKGKLHQASSRKSGKSPSLSATQGSTTSSDDRSPSPMDFSPRNGEDMEPQDGLGALLSAAANLSIGKDSSAGNAGAEEEPDEGKGGTENDGSTVAGKTGKSKRSSSESSSLSEDGEGSANSPESDGGTSNWSGFVFSASPLHPASGVQRRIVRKSYREKGPDSRRFVSVKGRREFSSGMGTSLSADQTIAEDLGSRLHIFERQAGTSLRSTEGDGSARSSASPESQNVKAPQNIGNPYRTEARVELLATPASPRAAVAVAAEQACEKWRLRGNQAYESGDFSKAEEYYSRGAGSVSSHMTSQSCVRALMLCYSNRAATRMAIGRMRDAIGDCVRAMSVDPNFLRVRLRLANCHLSLGETEAASAAFKECLKRVKEGDHVLDSKIAAEAAEGLKKTQVVQEYTDRALELLKTLNVADQTNALRLVTEALKHSQYTDKLVELKAIALLLLRKYEDAEQLCEQTLVAAERNYPMSDVPKNSNSESSPGQPYNIWRWKVFAKCKYHLGKLEESLEYLQRIEQFTPAFSDRLDFWQILDIKSPQSSTIRNLLQYKAAGNEAFQANRHADAVEQYTAALACSGDSRPFNAVCLCNRAAASQALGHIADAIADCSRAIALDPKYAKAISRRATLHELVRDYSQSVSDLQRLISLLESQKLHAKGGHGGKPKSTTISQDLHQARERLAKADEEIRMRKKDHPLDHYLILGVDKVSTNGEIKKAYRKAALRHHPDKAGQFVVWNDGADDTLWQEIRDEVRRDAERLFKLIGEANAVLSDPIKRAQYDKLEDARKIGAHAADIYADCTRNRRHHSSDRYESYSGYSQQYRWQSAPDAAQPDTYARRGRNVSHPGYSTGDGCGRYDWDD